MNATPDWIKKIVQPPTAGRLHPVVLERYMRPYVDAAAARAQAAWDEKVIAHFRGTQPSTDMMRLDGETYGRANFNRVIDGRPLVHHLIDRRNLSELLMVVSGSVENIPMVSRHDTDMEGRNPLDYAQDIGWEEGAEYLARYGFAESDRRMVDNHQTRIEKIMRDCFGVIGEDRSEFLRAALALGGDPDMMARPSLSLFHQAVVELSMPMAQALLEAGADISRLSARGETTLQVLWWCHAPKPLSDDWHAMARLLREHGADTTDFKLPDEMTAVELTHPLKGAIAGARGMDYALAAKRYDLYRKALIHLGPEKAAAELTRHCGLVQSRPLDSLCFNDTLGEVFTAEVWSGGTAHMRAAWATVAEQAAQPSRFRDDKPCRFTAEDFSAVTAQMDRQALARQRPRHLKL